MEHKSTLLSPYRPSKSYLQQIFEDSKSFVIMRPIVGGCDRFSGKSSLGFIMACYFFLPGESDVDEDEAKPQSRPDMFSLLP